MVKLTMLLRIFYIFFAVLSVGVRAQVPVDFQGNINQGNINQGNVGQVGIDQGNVAQERIELVENAYRLSVGDVVRIEVFGEPDLAMRVQLSELGTFNYPYLGELKIIGKTIVEVHQIITEGLESGFLVDPRVNVTVESYGKVFVGGEVRQSGSFSYEPGLTVSKAVFLAGGFTERSSKRRIKVRSEGEKKAKRVGLDYTLKPGDTVTVSRRFF